MWAILLPLITCKFVRIPRILRRSHAVSPLQRSVIAEAKSSVDEVVAMLEAGNDFLPGPVGIKLAKASNWLEKALGKDKSEAEKPNSSKK